MADYTATLSRTVELPIPAPAPVTLVVMPSPVVDAMMRTVRILPKGSTVRGVTSGVVAEKNWTIPIKVVGSSKDDLYTQESAIATLLDAGATLTIRSTGASADRSLKLLPGATLGTPSDEYREIGNVAWQNVIVAKAEPYIFGGVQTPSMAVVGTPVSSGSITTPCIVDFTVLGDYPTPLTINVTGTDIDINRGWIGLLPSAAASNVVTDFYLSGSPVTSPVNTGLFCDATYMAMLKKTTEMATAAMTFVAPDGSTLYPSGVVDVPANAMTRMCDLRMPLRALQGSAVANLAIVGAPDHALFVPRPYVGYTGGSTTHLRWQGDGQFFITDQASGSMCVTRPIETYGASRLLFYFENATAVIGLTVAVQYTPRYASV